MSSLSSEVLRRLHSKFGDSSPPKARRSSRAAAPPADAPSPSPASAAAVPLPPLPSKVCGPAPPFGLALSTADIPPMAAMAPPAAVSCTDVPLHADVLRRYNPIAKLGTGGYAVVLSVSDRGTGEVHVIKKIEEAYATADDAQRVFRELSFQRFASHPNLLPLLRALSSPLSADVYLLCPPMAMDLQEALRAALLPKPQQKKFVVFQILCALGYMHACGVLHRDLKPANVLLDVDCRVRVCDFGLVRTIPPERSGAAPAAQPGAADDAEHGAASRSIGSRWYRAPELLLGARCYGGAVDAWSAGCVVGEVLGGKTLLPGASTRNQLLRISQLVGGAPSDESLAALRAPMPAARELVDELPSVVPMRLGKLLPRADAQGIELVRSLLRLVPAERLSPGEALEHPYICGFVAEADERAAYAAASLGTAARFGCAIDDSLRLPAAEYKRLIDTQLAEELEEEGIEEGA